MTDIVHPEGAAFALIVVAFGILAVCVAWALRIVWEAKR